MKSTCILLIACLGVFVFNSNSVANSRNREIRDLCRDVKAKNENGLTCLHIAVQEDGPDILSLIQRGADVNAKGFRQWTPLHYAISFCRLRNAGILLEHGADVNARDAKGESPLHIAVFPTIANDADRNALRRQAVELLISRGADVNSINIYGRTPLHDFCMRDQPAMIEFLLGKGADVTIADKGGRTPLHSAAFAASYAVLPLLLAGGAKVNARTHKGDTPLSLARDRRGKVTVADLRDRYDKTIDFLLKHGAR